MASRFSLSRGQQSIPHTGGGQGSGGGARRLALGTVMPEPGISPLTPLGSGHCGPPGSSPAAPLKSAAGRALKILTSHRGSLSGPEGRSEFTGRKGQFPSYSLTFITCAEISWKHHGVSSQADGCHHPHMGGTLSARGAPLIQAFPPPGWKSLPPGWHVPCPGRVRVALSEAR